MDNFNVKLGEDKKGLISKFKLFFKGEYFSNRIVFRLIILSLAANAADWVSLAVFVRPPGYNIILHYNVYFGVDMMGDWRFVFVLPAIGLLLFFINNFLAAHFFANKERIASYVLLLAAFMIQISLLIASVSVIIINY